LRLLKIWKMKIVSTFLIFAVNSLLQAEASSCIGDEKLVICECPSNDIRTDGYDVLRLIQLNESITTTHVQAIHIKNCYTEANFELDFNEVEKGRFQNLSNIAFSDSAPIHVYMRGRITRHHMAVTFQDIHRIGDFKGLKGSVVLTGGVDYCAWSCDTFIPDKTGPPNTWQTCNKCTPSNLKLSFINVDHVLLKQLGLAAYDHNHDDGHAILHAQGVQTFSVDEPFLNNVEIESIEADECWLRQRVNKNPYSNDQVACNSYGQGSWFWTGNTAFDVLIIIGCGVVALNLMFCFFVACIKFC